MPRVIALLRGVNVGGRSTVRMAQLRELMGELGLERAETLLQSGNLVFEPGGRSPEAVEALLEEALAARVGLKTEVLARTHQDLSEVIAANPFPEEAARSPNLTMVLFMKAPPDDPAKVEAAAEGMAERVKVRGREAYVHYPDGSGRSKLKLPRGTMRNWNTVLKLSALAEG